MSVCVCVEPGVEAKVQRVRARSSVRDSQTESGPGRTGSGSGGTMGGSRSPRYIIGGQPEMLPHSLPRQAIRFALLTNAPSYAPTSSSSLQSYLPPPPSPPSHLSLHMRPQISHNICG